MIPQDIEAERAVLGALLVEPSQLSAASSFVSPADFGLGSHRAIFAALLRCDAAGALDTVTVKSDLERAGQLEAAGGAAYLGGLVAGLPRLVDGSLVSSWSKRIRERALFRRALAGVGLLQERAASDDMSADELCAVLQQIAEGSDSGNMGGILDRAEIAKASWRLIDEEISGKGTGISTGLCSLDRRLRFSGWRPGQLVYVGARTSRGKSALLVGMAEAAAAASRRVLMFSLEMTPEELGVRRLVAEAGVGVRSVHSWRREERDEALQRLQRAAHVLERPLDFAHPSVRTLAGIRAECRRAKVKGLDLVVVDYLGLVRDSGDGKRSLYERTTLVSQGLKALAIDLDVPVLTAVQLNRETSGGGRPSLGQFRDSGAVEQDADVCLLIHQADSVDAIREGWVELLVAKQRNGATGDVRLWWNSTCARFEDRAS